MKQKIFTYSTFFLLFCFCACTQDGLNNEGAEGTPMTFTAMGLGYPDALSRTTVDGTWNNVTDVAVRVGGTVKRYDVNVSGGDYSSVTLKSDNPFYWQSTEPIEVEAWLPYDESNLNEMPKVKVKADQSNIDDFLGSDYIYAHSTSVEFDNPSLEFKHRTVRMTVTLAGGNGITDISGATAILNGLNVKDGNPATVTPYQAEVDSPFDALLAPQTIPVGTELITVNLNGEDFHYITESEITLSSGQWHKYALRINGTKLELVSNTVGGWHEEDVDIEAGMSGYTIAEDGTYLVSSTEGLYAWAKKVANTQSTSCKLLKDITLPVPAEGESNWTPVEYFNGTFDGNGHSISGMTAISSDGTIINGGFFIMLESEATVKGLCLKEVKIKGEGEIVGGIAGINTGTIIACSVTGTIDIESETEVGGVTGMNDGTLTGCYFIGDVSGELYVGGVSGNTWGTTNACYWSGTVTNNSEMGAGEEGNSGTEVDGTAVTWQTATQAMNEALSGENFEWKYIQSYGDNNPPVLKKNK